MSKTIKIPGRLESAETGKVVAGANAILDDTKGKKQNVINEETDAELLRLDQEKQGNLTFDQTPTENSMNPVTSGGVYAADQMLSQAIEAILLLIPSAASELNKLVDLATMNISISTATASFKGTYNLVSDLHLTVSATHAQIAAALDALSLGADNNDYAFVQVPNTDTAPTDIAKTERYKFNGENWAYEYDLNNSGFTTAQWNAINSGITTLLVAKLSALPTNEALTLALAGKQDNLTFDNAPTAGSNNPVKSGGIYTRNNEIVALINALDVAKQNVLTFDTTPTNGSTNPVTSNGVYLAIQLVQTAVVALDGRMGTAETKISTAEGNIVNLQAAYAALTQSDIVVVSGALPSSGQQQNIIYRQPDQDHTPPQFYSDYMWNGTAWVLMATYNNAIDPRPKKGSQNLVTSGGVFDNMGALDVSELNATENPHTLKPYAILDDALADIPSDYQKGGMSIKFVRTSDNKYVQYRLMHTLDNASTAAADFANTANWQGIDNEPTAGSNNLVKSGGIANKNICLETLGNKTIPYLLYPKIDGWVDGSNVFVLNYNEGKHCVIKVNGGEKLCCRFNVTTSIFILKSYVIPTKGNVTPDFATGFSSRILISDYTEIDLPSDANYIAINRSNSTTNYRPTILSCGDWDYIDGQQIIPTGSIAKQSEDYVKSGIIYDQFSKGVQSDDIANFDNGYVSVDSIFGSFVRGATKSDGTIDSSVKYRIISTDFVTIPRNVFLKIASGFIITVQQNINGNISAYSVTNNAFVAKDTLSRISIFRTTEDASEYADFSEFQNAVKIISITDERLNAIDAYNGSLQVEFKRGNITGVSNYDVTVDDTIQYRVRSVSYVEFTNDTWIKVSKNFKILTFNISTNQASGWITSSDRCRLKANNRYYILIARADSEFNANEVADIAEFANGVKVDISRTLDSVNDALANITANIGEELGVALYKPHGMRIIDGAVIDKYDEPYRISTSSAVVFDRDTEVTIADGFRISVWENLEPKYWHESTFTFIAGKSYYWMVARITDNTSENANVLEFSLKVKRASNAQGYWWDNDSVLTTRLEQLGRRLNDIDPNTPGKGSEVYKTYPEILTLLHFSDLHDDESNLRNILAFYNKNKTLIDDVVCSGDANDLYTIDFSYWNACGAEDVLLCMGNHEHAYRENGPENIPANGAVHHDVPMADLYNKYYKDVIQDWGVTYQVGKTWWYKDYSNGIRLIAVDPMIKDASVSDYNDQITWLHNLLSDSISNSKHVILMQHFPVNSMRKVECNFSDTNPNEFSTDIADFLEEIKTFKTGGGKFICHLAGHLHMDWIGYPNNYADQLVVICNCAMMECAYSDMQRVRGERSGDCFNIISFDITTKHIKILRVGANVDYLLRDRNIITINYETKQIVSQS